MLRWLLLLMRREEGAFTNFLVGLGTHHGEALEDFLFGCVGLLLARGRGRDGEGNAGSGEKAGMPHAEGKGLEAGANNP